MPKLAIIDHVVSAAGVERFLHGLVKGLIETPGSSEWDISVLLAQKNSGGFPVYWPAHIAARNLHVRHIPYNRALAFFNRYYQYILMQIRNDKFRNFIPISFVNFLNKQEQVITSKSKRWIEKDCYENKYDVVYFSYPYLMDCPTLYSPIVITMHDFNYKQFNTLGLKLRAQIELQTPIWLENSKKVVVSSNFIADQLKQYYPEHSPKMQIIRAGIPESQKHPGAQDLKKLALEKALPAQFLLTVGWIVTHKNQKVIFEALAELRNNGISIPLVCVGPNSAHLKPGAQNNASEYVKDILYYANRAGLKYGKDYIALEYISEFELDCLYRLATMLIVSSLYEAGSFPLIEAVRSLCPVIASDIPSLVEQAKLLDDQIDLFNPMDPKDLADKIRFILTQPLITKQRAANAADLVNMVYSWNKMADGYLTAFQEAADAYNT